MLNESQARILLERAITLVRASKGAEGTASLTNAQVGNTRFAASELTSSGDVERTQLAITVAFGQRSATASTNQLDDRGLDDTVARAKRMAQLAPENPEELPPLGPQTYRPAKGARDPEAVRLGPEARAKAAGAALAAARDGAGAGAGAGTGAGAGAAASVAIAGYYEHAARMHAIATTRGAWAYHTWSSAALTCTARTADGTGSGWAGASSNRAADLDAPALAKLAVDKAVRSAKPTRLSPDRYTVILEPAAVAGLLASLWASIGARRADEGRSFFSRPGGGTRVGEKLFSDAITLRSDPSDPKLAAAPFDGEGLPLQPASWIEKGTVRALAYSRFWAKRQGKPATGQPAGFILDGGTASRDELLKGVTRGVLITRFWYLRSLDPQTILVTGLTRDGVFLIENGAITRPVNNFRFNESPIQMLARCDALSPAVLTEGGARVPALRTHDFNLASISEAV